MAVEINMGEFSKVYQNNKKRKIKNREKATYRNSD